MTPSAMLNAMANAIVSIIIAPNHLFFYVDVS